jgi:hypothetical protein
MKIAGEDRINLCWSVYMFASVEGKNAGGLFMKAQINRDRIALNNNSSRKLHRHLIVPSFLFILFLSVLL